MAFRGINVQIVATNVCHTFHIYIFKAVEKPCFLSFTLQSCTTSYWSAGVGRVPKITRVRLTCLHHIFTQVAVQKICQKRLKTVFNKTNLPTYGCFSWVRLFQRQFTLELQVMQQAQKMENKVKPTKLVFK